MEVSSSGVDSVGRSDRLPMGGRCAMLRFVIGVLGALAFALPAAAQVQPFPASFRTQEIETNGVTLHARVGGKGPAVVLLHGYGETGDMWAPLATALMH